LNWFQSSLYESHTTNIFKFIYICYPIYDWKNRNNKLIILIAGGIICLAVLELVIKLIIDQPFRSKLPDVPDLQGSPAPLSEQILLESKKAHGNASADNIGELGMIYHSSVDRVALAVTDNNIH